jgi:hypothetical protein
MANAALTAAIFIGIGALSSIMLPNPKETYESPQDMDTEPVRSIDVA